MLGVRCLEISFVVKPGNVMRWLKRMVWSRVDLAGLLSEAL